MKLELQGLAARHPAAAAGRAPALAPLNLSVSAGEALAVIGPSGAGKTTLLHALACALPPSAGRLQLDDAEPWALPRRELQRLRGRLFLAPQTPPLPPRQRVVTAVLAGALPRMSLLQSLRSLIYPQDLAAAHAALQSFDLADKLFERVDRLSGGERQRVALARALLAPAQLWLLDEPLSALDPNRASQALAFLRAEAGRRGVTLVASLHQVELALAQFPRIIGLREGRLQFDLPAAQVSPELLAKLYAQHEDELQAWAPADHEEDLPATAPAVLMQCR
ncbi:phosphonate ABC transporter ATP-binding protein [Paucibacter sp. DJ2R-2]|uniref:phosphonate ABC transporter ATP-binding protein n=1 Tax=Paucibacter sp. DJ2R-2 TaxID=2893558 RepID=UPI0021E49879|nr:ATP-binding cassette domain-containing protein [Paucibacter sp. DJ2R-2]MCV2421195.1 ATP-binding cassette domain-containing protein [Paucibacter sp. DJ4R-1]MCV2439173.1 ATP-binding cassette domain-containing protein [Paucibacter sp. DJ2R-2]